MWFLFNVNSIFLQAKNPAGSFPCTEQITNIIGFARCLGTDLRLSIMITFYYYLKYLLSLQYTLQ